MGQISNHKPSYYLANPLQLHYKKLHFYSPKSEGPKGSKSEGHKKQVQGKVTW